MDLKQEVRSVIYSQKIHLEMHCCFVFNISKIITLQSYGEADWRTKMFVHGNISADEADDDQ